MCISREREAIIEQTGFDERTLRDITIKQINAVLLDDPDSLGDYAQIPSDVRTEIAEAFSASL